MNTADFYLSLDIHESSAQAALPVKKGDTARQLVITLTENGKPYPITADCKAVLTAKKPDGNLLYNACTIRGNRIVYAFTAQTAAAAGEVACELRLYGADSALITSPRFLLLVDDTVYSDGDVVESAAEFSALVQLLETVKAVKAEIEQALENGDFKGDTGETSLPVARANITDGDAYTATDAGSRTILPTVAVGNGQEQLEAVGKGRQIVFVPYGQNLTNAPTLQLNGGEVIPIRLRAPQNQSSNDASPDATVPVPAGALLRGVPYTMTFCGKYWLVDSQIALMDDESAAMAERIAGIAISMAAKQSIGFPIINGEDLNSAGIVDRATKAYISRAESESETHPADGRVFIPTEKRVAEMIRKDITADYTAWTPESGTAKTVENYAKTLPDGSYRIANDAIGYCEIETFTSRNDVQWRFIRDYSDDFCYIELLCGNEHAIYIEKETGCVEIYGRKLLTNDNIPLPTAADTGKVLTASAAGKAVWTAVENAEEVAV